MDEAVRQALETDRVIDITTKGRCSGQERRIEIWFWNIDGGIYITGRPGRRGWYANLVANPEFTFHIKGSTKADLPARAEPIRDESRRREILGKVVGSLDQGYDVEEWVKGAPLVEVTFTE